MGTKPRVGRTPDILRKSGPMRDRTAYSRYVDWEVELDEELVEQLDLLEDDDDDHDRG